MNNIFQGRSLLAEKDFTKEELMYLIDFSLHLKEMKKKGIPHHYLEGKNIALLFEKSSTRTRSEWHPTQMIADFLTIKENFGKVEGITLAYAGDGRNNMANSLLVTGAILGANIRIVTPKELFPEQEIVDMAEEFAKVSGSKLLITADVKEGVKDADVLYTDVWVSMGEEDKFEERVNLLKPYQINMDMVKATGKEDMIVLHCLPAFHDVETDYGQMVKERFGISEMEITDEVFRSKYGRQFDQAENRMHSIKAIMAATLGNLFIPKA